MASIAPLRSHWAAACRSKYVPVSAIPNRIAVSRFHAASLSRSKDDAPKAETSSRAETPSAAATNLTPSSSESSIPESETPRLPRNVQAVYLKPLRRDVEYGVPSCDLQLRSYSVRNLEFFSDFALRAAYYLKLPAFGPVPLPRITERWTVPKSNFVNKKSQENFERKTLRRLIQIKDGHPETVELWLAFLKKHAYYGIGMKANVWEYNELGVGKTMDVSLENIKGVMEPKWAHFGRNKNLETSEKVLELMNTENPSNIRRLSSAIQTPPRQVIFSGIQPTGIPHLGNYLGALKQWVDLQDSVPAETKLIYSVVDLHAITVPQDPHRLRQYKREALATLLAIGIRPERSILFYQSSVQAHAELMWILSCTASTGYLSRMTQWKVWSIMNSSNASTNGKQSKLSLSEDANAMDTSNKAKLKLGLFSYPVLQAADILVHRATHVPVGEDQSQHLEFARGCADSFNHTYKPHLIPPETILSPAKRVMSLQDPHLKMSKSHLNPLSRILVTDSPKVIRKKIMAARTDSINSVSFDPVGRPGVANLLHLLSILDKQSRSPEELGTVHAGLGLGEFKILLIENITEALDGVGARYNEVMSRDDGKYLDHVEKEGAAKARESAEETMALVREAVGF
ncbi:hypothetical protein V495_01964 [Pseudogymnoascus sp. VKM F-4514 (FW-929)]|nr:hypothetical protein V495_01964 [Pseudogymnoascus sp. VKM F-4514 (FW-929)]KFY66670.1 hypothetical protein V497_00785 [Pseudogymnoascus sp. VKM F-4516 (FW-969)]